VDLERLPSSFNDAWLERQGNDYSYRYSEVRWLLCKELGQDPSCSSPCYYSYDHYFPDCSEADHGRNDRGCSKGLRELAEVLSKLVRTCSGEHTVREQNFLSLVRIPERNMTSSLFHMYTFQKGPCRIDHPARAFECLLQYFIYQFVIAATAGTLTNARSPCFVMFTTT